MNIIAIVEALLGLAAVALCAVACWREDKLIVWEDKHLLPLFRRIRRSIRCRLSERTASR
ncbi:MAG: hypothetical protein SPF51_00855 [Candidatus Fimivicinus sp.]|nr:hypothetical protein [Oscillospiraceae bacterium]MDY5590085.1 hypothetical protein [Candidatus Fimivicinus sp.]